MSNSAYCIQIEKLSRLAHPTISRQKWLAMIAYFDESGHLSDPNTKAISLAMVFAPARQWDIFQEKWRKRLRRAGMESFRASQFENGMGEFSKMDETEKAALITDLSAILTNTVTLGTAHTVIISDWNTVADSMFPSPFEKRRAPYIFLFQAGLHGLEKHIDDGYFKLSVGEKIACICEENRQVAHAAKEHYSRLKTELDLGKIFSSITFLPKDDLRAPLEAADLLAYYGFRYTHALASQQIESSPIKRILDTLQKSRKIFIKHYDRDSLMQFQRAVEEVRASRKASSHD
jgi:hypothetical protein